MVIVNGHIQLIGGSFDGKTVECCYQENNRAPQYSMDGQFIGANYTAMIEDYAAIDADGVRLFDITGRDLGLFQVSNTRLAEQVGSIVLVLTRHDN